MRLIGPQFAHVMLCPLASASAHLDCLDVHTCLVFTEIYWKRALLVNTRVCVSYRCAQLNNIHSILARFSTVLSFFSVCYIVLLNMFYSLIKLLHFYLPHYYDCIITINVLPL